MRGDEHWTRWDTRAIARRVQNMLVRGTLKSTDDQKKWQEVTLKLENGQEPTEVEHPHPYGFSSRPKAGAEVIVAALGGNRNHLVTLVIGDRRYRLKDLGEGEVAMHDDQGQKIHFKRDSLDVESTKPVNIKSPAGITLDGPITIKGDINQTGSITSTGSHTAGGGHL